MSNEHIKEYLNQVKKAIDSKQATEHSFRGHLETLIKNIMSNQVGVINEPKRIACGAPDYIIHKKNIPIGYIEAKDIGVDLNKVEKSEQMGRYLESIGENIILTDYLDFRFFRNGVKVKEIKLGSVDSGKLKLLSDNADSFILHIKDFCTYAGITIKSSEGLAKMMAKKARMMEEVIYKAVMDENEDDNSLRDQLKAFRQILIHDLGEKTFADIYAQTIAYGMFAARLHDKTLETFSRQEARELIPKTNPFLRNLFDYISGAQLDDRVVWIVDDLADIFRATDLKELLKDFGKMTAQNDPFLHFYETFLAEYDPALRKSRGVFYTPEPVVNFIVRAVDDILKDEFGISQGLACTEKIKIKFENDIGKKIDKEVHEVQILDPATGTGTFLAEVVKHIQKGFKGQEGIWSNYVDEHLIPRLNGFEILMASYTVCHLKLEMLLAETGYKPKDESKVNRLRVYLTNSLEEPHPDTGTLFASWLSKEATEANAVKKDTPVMVVLGNPPYSGESANKGDWIMKLMEDYKKEPGGIDKLDERNPKWINDDYMKFLRFGQFFIENKGEGIVAFINPHGFLDNPTFRGVRWNMLKTYDKIYTIDLHGNSKKKEVCPDGTLDENVFDIQQGVSINLFIKTGKKKKEELAKVFHYDLYGKREEKYNYLLENTIKTVQYNKLENVAPNYFFVMKDFEEQKVYDEGFSVVELFPLNNVGIVTAKDSILIANTKLELKKQVESFYKIEINESLVKQISYRPFDNKFVYYDTKLIERAREKVMQHFIRGENIGLITSRNVFGSYGWNDIQISKTITEFGIMATRVSNGAPVIPLYLYPESDSLDLSANSAPPMSTDGQVPRCHDGMERPRDTSSPPRTPNLNMEIVTQIAEKLNLTFIPEKTSSEGTFAPIDILDYIYAVLHSPSYREKYKEFLKIDFPRVPYPETKEFFWSMVKLGGEIRKIHLLEHPVINQLITSYPINGNNVVEKIEYKDGKVWINPIQYFDKVPEVAWDFYIGGYQPAQKWLKDRKGRELGFEDILHYQRVIVALTETARIMREIDGVIEWTL